MISYWRIARIRSWEDRSMRVAPPVSLSDEERRQLEQYERGRSTPARLVLRAGIVLLAAEGKQNCDIAVAAGTDRFTVARWRNRFIRLRLRGIEKDAPRPGRLPRFSQEMVLEIVRKTTQELPGKCDPLEHSPHGEGRWSQRGNRSPDLAPAWLEASSDPDVQAQQRSALCREA